MSIDVIWLTEKTKKSYRNKEIYVSDSSKRSGEMVGNT